ncbi:MAG TPA: hypothetical protein PKX46_01075 [Clostridia bacterium]|nr:hypothetical protein [Clostridia bacterium]
MRKIRIFSIVLCALFALMLMPRVAFAAGDVEMSFTSTSFAIVNGQVIIDFILTNNGVGDLTIKNNGFEIKPLGSQLTIGSSYRVPDSGDDVVVEAGKSRSITLVANDAKASAGNHVVRINVKKEGEPEPVAYSTCFITKDDSGAVDPPKPETPEDALAALMLASVGQDGSVVPAPKGNAGERIRLRLPFFNRSVAPLSNILVTPQLSASLDAFPFEIEAVDYTARLGDMRGGEIRELAYDLKLSKNVTSGVKEVKFNAIYYNNTKGGYETATVSAFVTVVKGASGIQTDEDGKLVVTIPKLTIEAYSIKPENEQDAVSGRLFAGEAFSLELTLRNNSLDEAVENIQLTLENEAGVILPVEGGSNTVFIRRIGAGESAQKSMKFQSAPDAESKAHTLSAKLGYESGKSHKSFATTETITLPISQRIRVRIDDPVTYGDAYENQPSPVYFNLYNMGKSSLYNCMVNIEGEGLRMEEGFFGGNVGPGSTMRADFNIIPSVPGEIAANVIVTYEDVYGVETRVEKPFTLFVQEEFKPDLDEDIFNPMPEKPLPSRGLSPLLIIGGCILAAGGTAAGLILKRRRRRRRELEDA